MAKIYFDVLEKISGQNDGISSEILPSFMTEAVEDRDVIFKQIKVSQVKVVHQNRGCTKFKSNYISRDEI